MGTPHTTINLYREQQQRAWNEVKEKVAASIDEDEPSDGEVVRELAGAYLGYDFDDGED